MEQGWTAMWTCLLGAGLTLAFPPAIPASAPRPPRLIGCVFLHRANVTCRWEPGEPPAANYTLKVEKMPSISETNTPLFTFTCSTSSTSCTAITESAVSFNFCVSVSAHGHSSSKRRCQSGRAEVMLSPTTLTGVRAVRGRPTCLDVIWSTGWDFPMAQSEIKAGDLESQIEFKAQEQLHAQTENVTVTGHRFPVCLFRPDTTYSIRLRHRYKGPESPWSPWSNRLHGRTGEDAPSAAPTLWRRIKQTDEGGWRLVSLLWKPLPRFLANGQVLSYNVTCRTEGTQVLSDLGSCRDLTHTFTSCSLRLPAGRCSCSLTASTSAGTSPEARIRLLGASETEPPSPSEIAVRPRGNSSFDVGWTAPVDRPASGFVVEWFAVGEKNSSVLYWERLNGSSTGLLITEGVRPLERYVVSVRALYGERGAGHNKTVHVYTRQGAPSVGPDVSVHQISGTTVELRWSPVPVEHLHGFIRNYTISYSRANQPAERVFVPGDAHRFSLENLSPGTYDIFMQANTDAGAGASGSVATVHIGSEEISILMFVLPLVLTSLALTLMACLTQNKVKQKLFKDVPDPSQSSLAHWTPKVTLESLERREIKYSEVVLLSEREKQKSDPDEDLTYRGVCDVQIYSSPCYSPLAQSPRKPDGSERKRLRSPARAKTTSDTDLSNIIYSNVLVSQTLKSCPAPVLSPSYLKSNSWQHSTLSVNDVKLTLGGAGEPPVSLQGRSSTPSDSPPSQADDLRAFRSFLRQLQSPVSFPDISSMSYSSLLSHPAEVPTQQNAFSQSLCNSVPALQPDALPRSGGPSDTLTTSLSPFPLSRFVDFSHCHMECDPYSPVV